MGMENKAKMLKEIPKKLFVQTQLSFFARKVKMDMRMNYGVPVNFADYLRNNFESSKKDHDIAIDPWGSEYVLRKIGNKYIITSRGPDGMLNTEDDIDRKIAD